MKYKWVRGYSSKVTSDYKPKKILDILAKNRGIKREDIKPFLNPPQVAKLRPESVGINPDNLEKAVKLINKNKEKKIIIFGDFDVDGISATAILWEALWKKGYDVLPYIPNREDGYGLKKESISNLIKQYPQLSLLITVDNGIVAYQAVDYAKEKGLDVIVTDHHLKQSKSLHADVVVHTTQLAGCGIAWFLANQFGYQHSDLAALGTIADLLPLVGPNRSFVKQGLKELGSSTRWGIRALKKISGLKVDEDLVPWQISYLLGPRLNASGRISDPINSLRILCTKKQTRAFRLAHKLDSLNKQRQEMTSFGVELAKELVDEKSKLIGVSTSDFHPGIIGLIASKLSGEFERPAIVISQGKKISKGSARSIPGINIVDLIRQAEDLLEDVGGHSMAAGFTLQTKRIKPLLTALDKIAEKEIQKSDLILKKEVDFSIDFSLLNRPFYQLIQKLAPFGVGNPEPKFLLENARIVNLQTVGSSQSHLKLWLDDPETPKVERIAAEVKSGLTEVIGFGWGEWEKKLTPGDMINLVFNLNLNRWNGKERLQLKIKDIELC